MTAPPREPTQRMMDAAGEYLDRPDSRDGVWQVQELWQQMYGAAPTVAQPAEPPAPDDLVARLRNKGDYERSLHIDRYAAADLIERQAREIAVANARATALWNDNQIYRESAENRERDHNTDLAAARAERDALRAENERQAREIAEWRTWGTVEVAIRNPNVASSMNHWEQRAERAEADLQKANIDSANLLAECSDMLVDIEKYRNEIAELKSERDAAQRAGVTTANYWMERAELAEDQRERTRDVWATRAERAEAERDALREVVKAADAMRDMLYKPRGHIPSIEAYDAARAKVKP